ncbi:MAG TPA: preprotein translocase subunit SecG [Clostridia bacterium]|nr:preprotein translocase subunit SecG [Clostridia bacterium]
MEIIKNIVLVIYILICFALIVVATIQTKDASGASETITGSSTNNFYEKNKGRTTKGKLKKLTVTLAIAFIIGSIVLGILYVI